MKGSAMNRLPQSPTRTQSGSTRRARRAQPVIGRRGFMTLAAGAGAAVLGTAGRGLFLPRVDLSRAAAAGGVVEAVVRTSQEGLLGTTPTAGGGAVSPARAAANRP